MKHFLLLFLSLLFCPLLSQAAEIDLSTPQSTYDTCYSTVDFSSETTDVKNKIKTCLTRTAQKSVLSYAVIGGYFIDSLKDVRGRKKHPDFMKDIDSVLEKHHFKNATHADFRSADLASILTDIIGVYSKNEFVTDKLQYSGRKLKDIQIDENTARGTEVFALKTPLPSNTLVLNFIKVDDRWLINHISYF